MGGMVVRRARSAGQGADLDQVVGEDSVSDPDPGAFGGVDPGSVPSIAAFEGADPAFAAGPPFHVSPKRSSVFLGLPGLGWSASAGDDGVFDSEGVQGVVDGFLAVTAVGSHGPWCPTCPFLHAFDRRGQAGASAGLPGWTSWSTTATRITARRSAPSKSPHAKDWSRCAACWAFCARRRGVTSVADSRRTPNPARPPNCSPAPRTCPIGSPGTGG